MFFLNVRKIFYVIEINDSFHTLGLPESQGRPTDGPVHNDVGEIPKTKKKGLQNLLQPLDIAGGGDRDRQCTGEPGRKPASRDP